MNYIPLIIACVFFLWARESMRVRLRAIWHMKRSGNMSVHDESSYRITRWRAPLDWSCAVVIAVCAALAEFEWWTIPFVSWIALQVADSTDGVTVTREAEECDQAAISRHLALAIEEARRAQREIEAGNMGSAAMGVESTISALTALDNIRGVLPKVKR